MERVLPDVAELVGTWSLDPPHSSLVFSVKHMMVSNVTGRFDRFGGKIRIKEDVAASSAVVVVAADSISTNDPERDEHLRSPDFLDAAAYPELRFTSRDIKAPSVGSARFTMSGALAIRDVTRDVVLDCALEGFIPRDINGHARIAFSGSAAIRRRDFGLTWNRALEAGGFLVGEEVKISLDVAAVRTEPASSRGGG